MAGRKSPFGLLYLTRQASFLANIDGWLPNLSWSEHLGCNWDSNQGLWNSELLLAKVAVGRTDCP